MGFRHPAYIGWLLLFPAVALAQAPTLPSVQPPAPSSVQTPADPVVQQPPQQPVVDGHATFRSSVDMVTLSVTVTDDRDHQVPGLKESDFQVLEDGVPQRLSFFTANEVPLDVALLIDTSSSMQQKLALVKEAAGRFIKTLHAGDRAEVVAFNSLVKVLQPFTSDLGTVERAVNGIVARGGTSLYTALYITLDQFMHDMPKDGHVRRPAIILLTDGEDTSSLIQFDDLLERARRAGVAIYSISAIAPDPDGTQIGSRRFLNESDFALRTLAKETGGQAFFPLKLEDLNNVYASVADELSLQYALGYAPSNPRVDGSFHKVLVRVVSRPEARPRTRLGYYSPRVAASRMTPAR